MKNNLKEVEGVKALRWVKASERPLPEIRSHHRINIKYKGYPDLLTYYHGNWYWGDNDFNSNNILAEESKSAIEWLEEYDLPQQVKALSAEEVAKKHGLPIHDPIHWYHIKGAMEEYALQSTPKLSDDFVSSVQNSEGASVSTIRSSSASQIGQDEMHKLIEKRLISMINKNSPKLIRFFVMQLGKMLVDAHAESMEFSEEANIKGLRYKILTVTTVTLLNSTQNVKESDARNDDSSTTADPKNKLSDQQIEAMAKEKFPPLENPTTSGENDYNARQYYRKWGYIAGAKAVRDLFIKGEGQ